MALLTFDRVHKSYGTKPLLDDVSFVIESDERVGVVGANGAGKTTLLRLAAGTEPADGGRILTAGGARIGVLSQRPDLDDAGTVLDAVVAGDGPAAVAVRDYEHALARLDREPGDAEAGADIARLSSRLDAVGGWDLESRARATLDRLGLTDPEAVVRTLSGGQRKRVALARAIVERPDLLILDEPTNHLDTETIEWLEGLLTSWTGALMLVTHDRYFLDRVTNRMIEVGGGGVQRYVGSYSDYLEQKAAQAVVEAAEESKRQNLATRELAWLRRGAKARTSKSKSRIDRAHALLDAKPEAGPGDIAIESVSTRLGKKVIELADVAKGWDGKTLFSDLTYTLTRDDRLGIIGPNGTGKTTLLELVAGRTEPDAGTIERGPTVTIGYYDQQSRAMAATATEGADQRMIDYVEEIAETIAMPDGSFISAAQMLERFLFPREQHYTPVGLLSGGERRRLYLLRVLLGAPNVLLLDEPTNDLDIPTLVALETYLDTFNGAVVVVSHDRYFLDRTVGHLLRIEGDGGRVREIPGSYSVWAEIEAREAAAAEAAKSAKPVAAAAAPPPPTPAAPVGKKLSYNEKRELTMLEERIASAEARQPEIEAALVEHATDGERIVALSAELAALAAQLEADVDRWAELAERA
ncbi:ABC-F family ATP-binding cassette domain-containing protein [Rubrivirga sp. IMCC43871]|uniref:ABC-F family ATP-binding cassette domain-containing protein n=1 Tax=Rubrivirga sp. IMCC43871 TaxID=3391575 RepID=UPI00398FFFC7